MRCLIKIPPPVILDDKKKRNRKNKRSQRKPVTNENREPLTVREKTKMYPSMETCSTLNRDSRSIYDCLKQYALTKGQLAFNNFPAENYQPPTLVDANNNSRVCIRCSETFEVFNGLYLSATKCKHHPKKAVYGIKPGVPIHLCCSLPSGSSPCSVMNHHVTLQHGPRNMTKTASRRHIKKDLQHRIFSLDCEMSYTTGGLEITRIGVVDIDGCTVYDSYVKPRNQILDFNTMYSGVEKRHMDNLSITIDDVKEILNSFIHEDTILVGHALNNDLAALGLIHNTVVDTSVMYQNPKDPSKKRSLKSLASEHLGLRIQDSTSGHDCIEDARTCLQLALLKVPKNPSPSCAVENSPSARPHRQPLAEGSAVQTQPLSQIQNMYEYLSVQQYSESCFASYAGPSPFNHNMVWEPEPFRYGPSQMFRNYMY